MQLIEIAVLAGFVAGIFLAHRRFSRLLLIAHHLPFRLWQSYDDLYNTAGTSFTHEMIKNDSGKTRSDFLNSHRDSRPYAESHFKRLWNAFALQLGLDYGIVLLISIALFWGYYIAFVVPLLLVHASYFTYLHFYKHYRLDFFAILMYGMVLEDHNELK